MKKAISSSPQTQQEATKIAKATQKPGQTKEQTKLIAQGIEHGITLYKKQQKEKQRIANKERKKQRAKQDTLPSTPPQQTVIADTSHPSPNRLPWVLLVLSWVGFIAYLTLTQN
jgi:hypothetical protein